MIHPGRKIDAKWCREEVSGPSARVGVGQVTAADLGAGGYIEGSQRAERDLEKTNQ